ncbi:unnamed protein product [Ostreobium quekettii]|uniref:Uncharacterized protein n=1 Tax=Ostreobium quekettii TaxID=121088 RepID=A0A8S1J9V7_9CHLO|nr:unnamed protein product [Ostreobium quekettii]
MLQCIIVFNAASDFQPECSQSEVRLQCLRLSVESTLALFVPKGNRVAYGISGTSLSMFDSDCIKRGVFLLFKTPPVQRIRLLLQPCSWSDRVHSTGAILEMQHCWHRGAALKISKSPNDSA